MARNHDYMITGEALERVRGWFTGRLPADWQAEPPAVSVDREEITVVLTVADVALSEDAGASEIAEARAGRAKAFREETRDQRIAIAREAERRFERKVSWGGNVGEHSELFPRVGGPVMPRLRQPQRQVLDTLVEAGVARSRADALAWCVRLVGQNTSAWLGDLRTAMEHVEQVRSAGPTGSSDTTGE